MDTLTKIGTIEKHEAPLRLALERERFHDGYRLPSCALKVGKGLRDVKTVLAHIKLVILRHFDLVVYWTWVR